MNIYRAGRRLRLVLAVALVLAAFALQWSLWPVFKPFVWFLFYPAAFFSAWVGGLAGGALATTLSTLLVWWFFLPPEHSFRLDHPVQAVSIAVFAATGMLCAVFRDRYDKLLSRAAAAEERERGAQALLESEQRYAAFFDRSPFALALTQLPQGTLVAVNDAFLNLFEFARDEVLGKTSVELGIAGAAEQAQVAAEFARRGALRDFEVARRTRSGAPRFLSLNLDPLAIGAQGFVLTTIRDVTGERAAQERQRRAAAALEAANAELSASRAAALNLMEDADIARRDTERSNAELIAARDEAQRLARVKSVFLAHMSHEIRTPLHIVIGLAHLLRRDLAAPAQRQRIEQLCATSDHLLALVNDILDLSKIEAGRLALDPGDFALAEVVDKVMRMVAESAREKGLTLTVDIAPAVRALWLRGDSLRLVQVLLNLCGNAVKFTERGGVRLAIERIGEDVAGALRFAVEDTGIGIAPADQVRLFQPFVQADSSATRAHGGSGLGLAISQHLVTLMGGTIRLNSRSGAGSRFEFDLVLPCAAAADGDATELAAPGEVAGRWVLLVEDHPLSQDILFEMLADLGCEVDVASDGIEAVSCAQAHRYDLILMDMQMPRLDGLAATGAIRALPQHRHTPILALTANAFADDRRRCLDAGMNDHIGKPVTPAALAVALRRWLPDAAEPAAGAPAAEAELPAGLADVAGLEVPSAMRRSPQTLAEYGTLLERFVAMHGEDVTRLRRHLAADELEAAHTLAHNLKGIAGLLGAKRVAALAHDIVQGLRADSAPIDLEPLAADCEAALARLAQAVAALPQRQGGTADEGSL